MLGPILLVSNSELLNFANNNTICGVESTIEELICTLEKETQATIDWFKTNEMIVNPYKFLAIIFKRNNKVKDSYPLSTNL